MKKLALLAVVAFTMGLVACKPATEEAKGPAVETPPPVEAPAVPAPEAPAPEAPAGQPTGK